MEHVAYREISIECSLMNAPLYLCYDGKERLYGVFFFFSSSCFITVALVREFSLETRNL